MSALTILSEFIFGYSKHRPEDQKDAICAKITEYVLLQAEAALIYDSVFVFAIGLQTLEQSHTLRLSNVSCDKEQPWDGGLSLINYINSVGYG